MALSTQRPRTPSPPPHLLTPPPTGGFTKRVRLAAVESTTTGSTRSAKSQEGESPEGFFAELQEGSDNEPNNSSEGESAVTASASPASDTAVTSERSTLEKQHQLVSLALAVDAPAAVTTPFPFTKLPLSIRNLIYEHLLVVPAIICVRQNHTPYHDEKKAVLYAERRELLPGIAYALAQITVDGFKVQFARFSTANINMLRVSRKVNAEAKAVLYGNNDFEIIKPTNELAPPPDYSTRLFPSGCQRLVTKLNIRIHSFYNLHWLLGGGHKVIKNYYRGLVTLTLILEKQSTTKGFGKKWARKQGEKWAAYIRRLHHDLAHDLFGGEMSKMVKIVPTWINLRVLFSGEAYMEASRGSNAGLTGELMAEQLRREEADHALVEAWELFKKGGK